VVSGIARTCHASRVGAVVSVRVEARVQLVSHVGCVWASVCGTRGCAAVVHVGVVAGVKLVCHVGVVSAVVGRRGCGVLVLGSGVRGDIVAYAVAGLFSKSCRHMVSYALLKCFQNRLPYHVRDIRDPTIMLLVSS
jgi:hypothetical protein